MDLGPPHPPYPPPQYTSRPTTPGRRDGDSHDNTPSLSSAAAPDNTHSSTTFHVQGETIHLQEFPSSSHNALNNVAGNEDSIPGHILAESRELAELHRRALELTIEDGGQATHGDASSEYEDFVEPDGQVLSSAQASIHDGGSARDDASVAGGGASHGPATGLVNASATAPSTHQVIGLFMLPNNIRPAPGQNAIYATPYVIGKYRVPTIHQIYVRNPASVLANVGGGGSNQGPNNVVPAQASATQPANNPSAPIAPSNTTANTPTPQTAPNPPDNASASAGNPHADEEYADWAEAPGPPPGTNNNAGNARASAPRGPQVYACPT
ncbi:hypothetical protein GX51_07637 [Blastomyces parvus]|uniref:Uncharacterized protein n=1 Tax=Blastomyces parvus TaxID=2060905 RepID=A0A2B7WJK9_9EURO|nr:hypothetical protein GX51_07637 [Blastomyces parvus]